MKNIFENPEPDEKNKALEKVRTQITSLIKDKKMATDYCQLINDVVSLYDDPLEAARILNECFEKYVKYEFNEKNFNRFARSIDPRVVFQSDAQYAFHTWEDGIDKEESDRLDRHCDCSECLIEKEKPSMDDFDKCESNFIANYKKNKIIDNKKFPQRMSGMRLYALLQEDKITDQDRLAKELAPNKGPDPFAWNRMPRVPFGGQPGYKLKRKRP